MVVVSLALPIVSLAALGIVWLWQNEYVLHWTGGALALALTVFGVLKWLSLRSLSRRPTESNGIAHGAVDELAAKALSEGTGVVDPQWTTAEVEAWHAVVAMTESLEPDKLDSVDALYALGRETVETVARELHRDDKEPLLRFTVPEALALIEQVSGSLRRFMVDNVPLSGQITVGLAVKLYGWRSALNYIGLASDAWRVIRMFNPLTGIPSEVRDQVLTSLYDEGKERIRRRLAERYVEEVGRAAILLFSGRLRVSDEYLAGYLSEASKHDANEVDTRGIEPLRIVVAGQMKTGKSSLINALSGEVQAAVDVLPTTARATPYRLTSNDEPFALLFDTPGFENDEDSRAAFAEQIDTADLLIWVTSAGRADRELDRQALSLFRDHYTKQRNRRPPPMFVALTHIDRLRPLREWAPPYDLNVCQTPKAQSILDAMNAVSTDLGVSAEDIIPVVTAERLDAYNIDAVWAQIHDALPQAQSALLVRCLRGADRGFSWRELWTQTRNSGRVLAKTMLMRSR